MRIIIFFMVGLFISSITFLLFLLQSKIEDKKLHDEMLSLIYNYKRKRYYIEDRINDALKSAR